MLIAGTATVAAPGAMIVGALQSQRAEYTLHLLGPAADIAHFAPTRTPKASRRFIGEVCVETLLNGVGREPQSTLTQSDFQSLEIQLREGFPT